MNNFTPIEVLSEARQLISDPSMWTQGAEARTSELQCTCPDDEFAACWVLNRRGKKGSPEALLP